VESTTPQLQLAPAVAGPGQKTCSQQLGSAASRTVCSWRRDEGQALVEYALILMLVALLAITALTSIGGSVTDFLNDIAASV
jgi:Flp pilus assembly pilin Flp